MRLQNQNDLLQTFTALIERNNKRSRNARVILLVLLVLILVGSYFLPATGEELYWKIGVLSFVVLAFVWPIIYSWRQVKLYDPVDSPIIQSIKYKNRDNYFTWIYPFKQVYNGVPTYYIVWMGNDKKRMAVTLKSEEEFELIHSLQALMPNVTYGFSEDLKAKYKKDPESLLQRGQRFINQ